MSWIEQPPNEHVGSFDLSQLSIDEAILNFTSTATRQLWLYTLSSACYSCPFTRINEEPFLPGLSKDIKVDTSYPIKYRLRTQGINYTVPEIGNDENNTFCDFGNDPLFKEFGVYNIHVSDDDDSPKCSVTIAGDPVNIYLPLVLAIFAYMALLILLFLLGKVRKRWKVRKGSSTRLVSPSPPSSMESMPTRPQSTVTVTSSPQMVSPTLSSISNPTQRPQRLRLRSLDTFRGICIVVMIFVNFGGGKYYFFEHAIWDGLTVADLVFPWFLWIMGVCVPIAIKSQVKREIPRFKIFQNILIRSIKLIGLGLLYNSLGGTVQLFGEEANLRIPGVLQRFGICYFVAATLVLLSMTVNFTKPGGRAGKFKGAIQDLLILWISWIPILVILLTHFLLTFFLPVPGCPTGYLGPGGLDLANNATVASHCIGGASGYIDLKLFGQKHIYNYPTAKLIFESGPYDPEGFLGTLTSIFQVWLGVQTGATMLVYPRPMSRLKRWGIWAIITGVFGGFLCLGTMTGGWIPVNKNLWTVSYVLVTSCFANILLSGLYFVIDMKKWWSGSPFFEPGMNSILLYMGHSILGSSLPWHWTDGLMRTHFVRLAENLWATSLWTLVGVWLHYKKLYWSV